MLMLVSCAWISLIMCKSVINRDANSAVEMFLKTNLFFLFIYCNSR